MSDAPTPSPHPDPFPASAAPAADRSVLHNPNFMALWVGQTVAQTVNTALQFVLLIFVVEETNSSIAGSGLIISLAAPPVVFGLVSGVIVDRLDKRSVLLTVTVVRAVATGLLVIADASVASIFAVAFVTATMGQFALTTSTSVLPQFVTRQQLLSANTVFQLSQTGAQLAGMIMLAPLMLKGLGFTTSYILAAVLLLATVPVLLRLPVMPPVRDYGGETWRDRIRAVPGELGFAWTFVRRDRPSFVAVLQWSTGAMLLFMFALLVPRFVKDVLDLDADNSVFVFWPTGVGALVGLRLLPALGHRFSAGGIVTMALFGVTASVAAFGGVPFLVDFMQDHQPFGVLGPDQVGGVSLLVFVTLLFAFPLGVSYAMVNAPAQTVLHERAPAEMRGRIFAVQLMLANGVSMVALLVIGGLTDAIGVELVMFVVAGMTLCMAFVSVILRRNEPEVAPVDHGAS